MNQDAALPTHAPLPVAAPTAAEVLIRPLQPEDLEAVKEIDRLSFSLPWPENAYRFELFENPGSRLWVAELHLAEGKPVIAGVIVVWLILDEAHIATLAVHPQYRRLGLARELLATALLAAIRAEMRLATLEVRAGNLAAQQLYRHFGFEVVGGRPRYYRDNNEDALIMTVSGFDDAYLQWLENHSYRAGPAPRPAAAGAAP